MMDEIRHIGIEAQAEIIIIMNNNRNIIIIISYTDFAMHTFVSINNIIIYIKMTLYIATHQISKC